MGSKVEGSIGMLKLEHSVTFSFVPRLLRSTLLCILSVYSYSKRTAAAIDSPPPPPTLEIPEPGLDLSPQSETGRHLI